MNKLRLPLISYILLTEAFLYLLDGRDHMYKLKITGIIIIIILLLLTVSACDFFLEEELEKDVVKSTIDLSLNIAVVSESGLMISGARVIFELDDREIVGYTDTTGNYLFRDLELIEGKNYSIKVEHQDYIMQKKIFNASTDIIQIRFTLKKENIAIDPDDNDAGNALISINGYIDIKHNFPASRVDLDSAELIDLTNLSKASSDEIIIKFTKSISQAEREEILINNGLEKIDQIKRLDLVLARQPEVGVLDASIFNLKGIEYIEANYELSALNIKTPNDEKYPEQWNYPLIRLPQAWTETTGSSKIRIGILDTGVDYNHPELQGKIDLAGGYNIIDDNQEVMDFQGHGTHVAGIIGAATNNQQGIAGVMWDVELVPIKILDDQGEGDIWNVTKGILYAAGLLDENVINKPVDIINLSVGSTASPTYLYEAIQEVADKDILMVAASGNSGSRFIFNPANYSEVIAVGSIDYGGLEAPTKSSFSSYGGNLDLVAPGNSIYSLLPDGNYGFRSGTSMAAPHVTGVAGLMLANGIPPRDVRSILQRTAISLSGEDFDSRYGYGLINSYWAVNNIKDLRIIIGERKDDIIDIVKEKSIKLKGGHFTFEDIPAGQHQVIAWIDLSQDGRVSPGDYYGESDFIDFINGKAYNLTGEIEEVGLDVMGMELNRNLISVID